MELKYTLDSRGDIPTYGFDHHGYTVIRNNSTTAGPTLADRAASLAASTLQSSKDRFASASSSQGKSGKKTDGWNAKFLHTLHLSENYQVFGI